jgi:hypothetical protein
MIGKIFLRGTIVIIVGVLAGLLGITSEGLVFQYGNFATPGMYVEHWLFRPPSGGGLNLGGWRFVIMFSLDSFLWFVLVYGAGAVVLRFWRRKSQSE